jgi:hypothetical protein
MHILVVVNKYTHHPATVFEAPTENFKVNAKYEVMILEFEMA